MTIRHSALALAAGVLLAGCSHGSMNSTSIADGRIVVQGEQVALHGTGGAEARLDAAGDLTVGGRSVALDATQRQLLQQYYQGARAVREHGIATGKAGAAIGVQALKSAATHVTGGDGAKADASLDAATRQVDEEASKICLDLQQIKAAQDRLATSLAAFRPFAGILDAGANRCGTRERAIRVSANDGEVELRSDKGGLVVRQTPPRGFYGLQPGDRVVAVNGMPIDSLDAFLERLGEAGKETADLEVVRDGKTVSLAVPREACSLFL
jgi:hypothetical protein